MEILGMDHIYIAVSEPAEYPEYNDDDYAIFFEDPDGLRLELVARSRHRERLLRRWDDLRELLNPIAALGRREGEG